MTIDELFTAPAKPRNISNSEVTAFLSCKRMYDFAFMQELAPKETAEPLARGSIGHQALEFFWRARMEGASYSKAMEATNEAFTRPCENTTIDVVMNTQFITTRYLTANEAMFSKWRPLGIEEQHDVSLTSTLNMTIKYDLYYEDTTTGKRKILDWKYAYDFWTPEDHDLNGQMPKYIACMQANDFQVDGGVLAEIRTRPLGAAKSQDPKNLFRFTPYTPSRARKESVLKQHVAASLQIERHRNLSPEERLEESIPVLNKHGACKFCNFKDLCNSMIEGKRDLTVDIRTGYTQSTYGYNKDEPLDIL